LMNDNRWYDTPGINRRYDTPEIGSLQTRR
jgi:hypothetical protein